MKMKEHVVVCASEEAGEVATAALGVAKALNKILRFGQDNVNPETGKTGIQTLVEELNDLEACVELLQEQGIELPGLHDRKAIEKKKKKVRALMFVAYDRGLLEIEFNKG